MKKRIISFCMAVLMLFGTVPIDSFTAYAAEADGIYFLEESLWLPEGEEPTAETVEAGEWVKTEETQEVPYVCPVAPHTHVYNCGTDAEGKYTCGGHEHSLDCYAKLYDHEEHSHSEACGADCTIEEHVHSDDCSYTLGEYVCGLEEHKHVTDGCPADCAIEEHSHEGDPATVKQVKWVVAEKDAPITTYAGENASMKEFPVSFFVTTLDQAKNPNGTYVRYKDDLWGGPNDTEHDGAYATVDTNSSYFKDVLKTQQGNRANMNEDEIINIISQWPADQDKASFRTFSDSITVKPWWGASQTFSGDEYEVQWVSVCWRDNGSSWQNCDCISDSKTFEHLHIDGILTKKVTVQPDPEPDPDPNPDPDPTPAPAPGAIKLKKVLEKAPEEPQTFYFDLYTLAVDTNYNPIDQTTGSPVAMKATVAAGKTEALISPTESGISFGFGYYKLVERANANDRYMQTQTLIGSDSKADKGPVYINVSPDGTVKYSRNFASGYKTADFAGIKNEAIPTTDISVKKIWQDNNNQDGKRPDSIEMHLLRNGTHMGESYEAVMGPSAEDSALIDYGTEDGENTWTAVWHNLPLTDASGNYYTYTVEEEMPDGYKDIYTVAETGDADSGFVLTNSYTPEKTTITARKVWHDDSNRDGLRTDSVQLQLYVPGEGANAAPVAQGEPVPVSDANGWTAQWIDLPVYKNGQKINYSIGELDVPEGYEVEITVDEHTGQPLVINTHEPDKTSIQVIKIWDDDSNNDGQRPESIRLMLYADNQLLRGENGEPVILTVTPNAATDAEKCVISPQPATKSVFEVNVQASVSPSDDQWDITIENLWKHSSGSSKQEIVYTVEELPVSGYTTEQSGMIITNSRRSETCSVTVSKVWDDNANQDGIRPDSVTVYLYADGNAVMDGDTHRSITLSPSTQWKNSFDALPKYKNGSQITYSVDELTVPEGYEKVTTDTDGNSHIPVIDGEATITNKHTPQTVSLQVEKHWNDDNNRDRLRPYAVEITLSINGVPTKKAMKLNASNDWTGQWEGLPRYADGVAISYTVTESAHYMTENGQRQLDVPTGYYAKNYYSTSTDPEHMEKFTEAQRSSKDVIYAETWNTHDYATVTLNIDKQWNDSNDRDNARPESVTFHVYRSVTAPTATDFDPSTSGWEQVTTKAADGSSVPLTAVIEKTADGRWLDIEVELPKNNSDGQPLYYAASEVGYTDANGSYHEGLPEGYSSSYNHDMASDHSYVTNNYRAKTATVTAKKVWNDDDNRDNIRPAKIELTLYANGNPITTSDAVKIVAPDANGNWPDVEWTDRFVNTKGAPIVYSVVESGYYLADGTRIDGIPAGYTSNSGVETQNLVNGNVTFTITNSHEPETTTVSVVKEWADDFDRDKVRPYAITVGLYATDTDENGSSVVSEVLDANGVQLTRTLYTNGTSKVSFEGLPKYKAGKVGHEIVYSVKEISYQMKDGDTFKALELNGDNYWIPNTALNGLFTDNRSFTDGYTPSYENSGNVWKIINTHNIETTTVKARKVWDDRDDADGNRPYSLTFHLMKNGDHSGDTQTFTADDTNNWRDELKFSWENVPKYENSEAIRYSVTEDIIYSPGAASPADASNIYLPSYSRDDNGTIVVTNTYEYDTTSVTVFKEWHDDSNRDGKRPESIVVTLQYSEDGGNSWKNIKTIAAEEATAESPALPEVKAEATLNDSNYWRYTWTRLPVNVHGSSEYADTKLMYRVVEKLGDAANDYRLVDAQGKEYEGIIAESGQARLLNYHKPESSRLTITKLWDDNNNQDGIRPDSISFELYANHVRLPDTDGNPVTLTVKEDGSCSITQPRSSSNTPISLTAQANCIGDTWTVTIDGLLRHANGSSGTNIVYGLKELPVDGYTVEGAAADNFVKAAFDETSQTYSVSIKNVHTPELIDIPVTKLWGDDNNRDGIRPESVTVYLYAGNNAVMDENDSAISLTLSSNSNWTDSFKNLPKYKEGSPIAYGVREPAVPDGYSMTSAIDANGNIPMDANGVVTVTNKHDPATIALEISKVWDDDFNRDGHRPAAVHVTVNDDTASGDAAGEVILSADNGWTARVEDLPRFANGTKISYTVVEDAYYTGLTADNSADESTRVAGTHPQYQKIEHFYSTSTDAAHKEKFTQTQLEDPNTVYAQVWNTHSIEIVSLNIDKIWDDDNDRDGKRPEELVFDIYKVPEDFITSHDRKSYNLDSVIPDGWEQVMDKDAQGATIPKTAVLKKNENGVWHNVYVNLPRNEKGSRVYYAIKERAPEKDNTPIGYTTTYTLDVSTARIVATNSLPAETQDFKVKKTWDDNNNQDGIRPDSITVTLYANGVAYATQVLSAENDWEFTWNDRFVNTNGNPILYSVVEDGYTYNDQSCTGIPAGYTPSYGDAVTLTNGDANYIIITNTHQPEQIAITANKQWDDDSNRDRKRPENITLYLYNGEELKGELTLSAQQHWTGSFEPVDRYSNGKEISYTVKEMPILDAQNKPLYTLGTGTGENFKPAEYISVTDGLANLVNHYDIETVTVTADKVWDDGNNRDGKRPDTILLHLLADSKHTGRTMSVAADPTASNNTDRAVWENLPKYNEGELIAYSVSEDFSSTHADSGTGTADEGIAPQAIQDYTPSYSHAENDPLHWTVTNSYSPAHTSVTVSNIWIDDDNRDGIRVDSVEVKLLKQTGTVQPASDDESPNPILEPVQDVSPLTLNDSNYWTASWLNLPKNEFKDGKSVAIKYFVEKTTVTNGYETTIVEDMNAPGYIVITNVHKPETTGITVSKIWDDDDNRDGIRPDGIIVQLFTVSQDNTVSAMVGTKAVLRESQNWSHTWPASTPLYVNENGKPIKYTVVEIGYIDAEGVEHETDYSGITEMLKNIGYEQISNNMAGIRDENGNLISYSVELTNKHELIKTSVSVSKEWSDNENQDGIRPDSVKVTLKDTFGNVYGDEVTLNAENQWKYEWTDLYANQGGVPIEYYVEEQPVEGYTASCSKTDNAIVITNTHVPATRDLVIEKIWRDNNNAEGHRPAYVNILLYKNGVAEDGYIVLSEENNWKMPVSLPVYENGEELKWTIKEGKVPRYYSASYDQENLTVTNTIQSKVVAKTGDYKNPLLWLLGLGGCVAGAGGMILSDRKKKRKH